MILPNPGELVAVWCESAGHWYRALVKEKLGNALEVLNPSVYMYLYMYLSLYIYIYIYLFMYLSIYLPMYLCIYVSIYISIYLFI